MSALRPVMLVGGLLLGACGPSIPRHAERAARDLEALGLRDAADAAPDLVAAAEAALADAERAERLADPDAAADFATRARLLGQAALAERERLEVTGRIAAHEREIAGLEEEAIAAEREAAREIRETAIAVAGRAARVEMERARTRAEEDEARTRRRARVSLEDAGEMRRAAEALRERALLLSGAAEAMGADGVAASAVRALVARSRGASEPLEALALADEAHDAGRALLGQARREARSTPSAEERESLRQSARTDRLELTTREQGPSLEVQGVFAGTSTRPSGGAEGRMRRLASLLAAHPHGPAILEVDVRGSGESALRVARARLTWMRDALVSAGVPAERLSAPLLDSDASSPAASVVSSDAVRVVLPAYAE